MHSNIALENVCLRLRTIYEFGNTASSVSGVANTLRSIRNGVSGVLPEIGNEIFKVETTLGDIVMDIGGTLGAALDSGPVSEDASRILKEAAIVVESRTKERLPNLSIPQEGSYVASDSSGDNQV
jgi:division protein CdvB (Snf7/Vps24/ESCRT-III family)